MRQMNRAQKIEQSIVKKYHKELWRPFMASVRRYRLIESGDSIAVCVSGGKDSMLLAKMMQTLARHSEVPFSCRFLAMDPGYSPANRARLEQNAAEMGIPLEVFATNVFTVANRAEKNPCYLCARMRRGHLYHMAQEAGCNKIALGHHFNDVIETTVMALFHSAQLQGMLPMLHSRNFPGMTLIRPLYAVHENDIIAWARYNGLTFLRCACSFTEGQAEDAVFSARRETKELIARLKRDHPDVEKSIFNALHAVAVDTFPGYKRDGSITSFLEKFDQEEEENR